MKKTFLLFFLSFIFSLQALSEKEFFLNYCENNIDELSSKLSHYYVSDLCEWYYIYGQMNAFEHIYLLVKELDEEKEN